MDPYALGYLSGSTFVLATIGYFVGRKLIGPSGVDEVERLKRLAGVAEPGAKSPSRLRGCVPYLLAAGGALLGLGFGIVSLVSERKGLVYDPAKLENGFLSGCEAQCAGANGNSEACHGYCVCVLGELKREHPTPESLKNFFQAGIDKQPAAQRELQSAQAPCLPRRATPQ